MFKTLRSRVNVKKRERSAKSQLPSFSITFLSLVQQIVSFAGFLHSLLTHSQHKGDFTSSKTLFFAKRVGSQKEIKLSLLSWFVFPPTWPFLLLTSPTPSPQRNSVPTQKTAGKRQQCGLQKISQLNLVWLTQNNHWRIFPTWSQFLVLAAFSWFSLHYLCQ